MPNSYKINDIRELLLGRKATLSDKLKWLKDDILLFVYSKLYWAPRNFIQRTFRGYCDTDIQDLSVNNSKKLVLILEEFKKETIFYPQTVKSIIDWRKMIDDMIFFHDGVANGYYHDPDYDHSRYNRGKNYFFAYYEDLIT